MNKMILQVFCLSFILSLVMLHVPVSGMGQELVDNSAREQGGEQSNLDSGDFEDFFNTESVQSRVIQREKKEPLSRAKVMLIQLGIKAALMGESAYLWLRSWLLWFVQCFDNAQV